MRVKGRARLVLNEPVLLSLPGRYDRLWLILNTDRVFPDNPDRDRLVGALERSLHKDAGTRHFRYPGVTV